MIIAVSVRNGAVSGRFRETEEFIIYEIEAGKVNSRHAATAPRCDEEVLVTILRTYHVDLVLCGAVTRGAEELLMRDGIKFFGGVAGPADRTLSAWLDGSLEPSGEFRDLDQ